MTTVLEKGLAGEEEIRVEKGGKEASENQILTDEIFSESETRNLEHQEQSNECEIVFPIDDENVNQKAFDFVIQMARRFSARIVLVHITTSSSFSSEFMEYVRNERIRDYEWRYYNSLASEKLAALATRAEKARVRWRGSIYFRGIQDVLDSYSNNPNALVIMNKSTKESRAHKLFRRFLPSKKSGARVPVLMKAWV